MSGSSIETNKKDNLQISSCLCAILLLLMLIASLCVYFVGYVNLGKTNERLVLTNCTIVENRKIDKICNSRCSYNRKIWCSYSCYDWKQIGQYITDNKPNNFTYKSGYDYRYYSTIENAFDEKPVGFVWECYYDPKHKNDVVDSLYNMKAWRNASIIMFSLTIVDLMLTLILSMLTFSKSDYMNRMGDMARKFDNKNMIGLKYQSDNRANRSNHQSSLYRSTNMNKSYA